MRKHVLIAVAPLAFACDYEGEPRSSSGVGKASVKVQTQPDGLTTEQANVRDRLVEDNRPGAIKHIYFISPYSGQVLLYSTVRGKVSSGGKRLTPTTITSNPGEGYCTSGFDINIGGSRRCTDEVLQDDGTYGSSSDYLFWWDTKGVYHQHVVTGGQIIHVSSEPIAVKSVVLNLSSTDEKPAEEVPVTVTAPVKK